MGYWDYDQFSTKARHIESRDGQDSALVYSTIFNDAKEYPSSYQNNFDDLHTIPQLAGPKHQYNGKESFEEAACKCEKCSKSYDDINIKVNFQTLLMLFLICIVVMALISDYVVMVRMRQFPPSQPNVYYNQTPTQSSLPSSIGTVNL